MQIFESARVEAPLGIKREYRKRASNDPHRLSVHRRDNHIGPARSLPGENGQKVVCRISQRRFRLRNRWKGCRDISG
ncbi:hypothetical protein [Caballeronia choica]|uniref:hypothetical protein n=1 Tax=Caballeronia choica TaxID=326476 RepID=UPI000AEFCE3B|nr:hypothetical protein [Caballeronia choica]